MKTPASFLIFLIILMLGINTSKAQDVIVILQQPPPNLLRVTDMWNLTLTNKTSNTLKVFLKGTLSEGTAGVIVDGASKIFNLPPGTKTITYDDVKSGSVNFKEGKWREAFTRTGNAPSGDYTICIYAMSETNEELGRDCIDQSIEITGAPELVSPSDGEEIVVGTLPTFTWLPPMPTTSKEEYILKIVELIGNQSPEEAMNRNNPFFESKVIKGTTFPYPTYAPRLVDKKKYVWFVEFKQSGKTINRSGSSGFTVKSNLIDITIDSLKISCCENGKYNYQIFVRNVLAAPVSITEIKINKVNGVTTSINISPSPGLTHTIPGNTSQTFTGTLTCIDTARIISFLVKGELPSDPSIINTESAADTLNCLCIDCNSIKVNFNNFSAALSGSTGNLFAITGTLVSSVPVYGVEIEVQSYNYTAVPPPCSNGITSLEQSGMFLIPGTTINGSPVQLFNEQASGSPSSNINASKIIKLSSASALSGNIPVNLLIGLPGPISGLNKDCCKMSYKVCIKVKIFYDKKSCKSCTFTHCIEFSNK